jgi:hypothetical protein
LRGIVLNERSLNKQWLRIKIFYALHAGEATLKRNYGIGCKEIEAVALDSILKNLKK